METFSILLFSGMHRSEEEIPEMPTGEWVWIKLFIGLILMILAIRKHLKDDRDEKPFSNQAKDYHLYYLIAFLLNYSLISFLWYFLMTEIIPILLAISLIIYIGWKIYLTNYKKQ